MCADYVYIIMQWLLLIVASFWERTRLSITIWASFIIHHVIQHVHVSVHIHVVERKRKWCRHDTCIKLKIMLSMFMSKYYLVILSFSPLPPRPSTDSSYLFPSITCPTLISVSFVYYKFCLKEKSSKCTQNTQAGTLYIIIHGQVSICPHSTYMTIVHVVFTQHHNSWPPIFGSI